MITKFKIFEDTAQNPEKGDYVLLDFEKNPFNSSAKKFTSFINNNIGKIIDIYIGNIEYYTIKYYNVPSDILDFFENNDTILCYRNQISNFSKNKKDLSIFLSTEKYNI